MDEIVDQIWNLLHAGANAGIERSPFTMLQAATVGVDGAPAVRNVVLRRASREERSLVFHTDVRSQKVAELRKDARISIVGSDLDAGIQIRLQGIARIVEDPEETRPAWNLSRPRSLIVYRTPLIPGTPVASPEDAFAKADPGEDGESAGFENFCLIDVSISKIDYLNLHPSGHVRVSLEYDGERWRRKWVAP
ncbi:pyridoxamine 5'-phosphate oxidase family protein [Paraburkholderia nemoris]|uniref:pyridoxamine 5'-phosphate oxidase family protein n=1 Tax=Paraburkholderia nemoris TaxID=2793076 RepID=UPI0038BA098A